MARGIEPMKPGEADSLVRCQRMRLSRAQAHLDRAESARADAAKGIDAAQSALERHAAQVEQELRDRYAELRNGTVGLRHLLALRAYEQATAQETNVYAGHLVRSKDHFAITIENETVAEQEWLRCARRMAKREEVVRVASELKARADAARLQRLMEDAMPTRQPRR